MSTTMGMVDCAKCGHPVDPLAPEPCEVSGLCAPSHAPPAPHLSRKTPDPCPDCGACGTDPCKF